MQLHLPAWFSLYMLANSALIFFSYFEMMGRLKVDGALLWSCFSKEIP